MPSGQYDRLTGEEVPMPLGVVIHGIRRLGAKFAVIRVTQLLKKQREKIVRMNLTEQEAERVARDL